MTSRMVTVFSFLRRIQSSSLVALTVSTWTPATPSNRTCSLLRPVFYSARQLGEFTELPVIGIVDGMRMEQRMAQELRALWAYCGATAALVLAAVITLLVQSATSHFIHQLMA